MVPVFIGFLKRLIIYMMLWATTFLTTISRICRPTRKPLNRLLKLTSIRTRSVPAHRFGLDPSPISVLVIFRVLSGSFAHLRKEHLLHLFEPLNAGG